MRNSKQLLFLTFLSLIICSYARKNIISSSPSASPSQLPVGSDANHISISPSLHVDTPYSSPPAPLEYVSPSPSQVPKLAKVSPSPSQGNLESISLSPSQGNLGNVSPSPSQAPKGQKVSPSPSQALGDVSPSLSPKAALTPSINKWCGETDYPDLCVEMISSSLKDNSDLNGAVNVAIKLTEDTAKAGMEKISKLPQVESEPMYQDYLNSVQDSLDYFKNAQDALTKKQMLELNTQLTAALTTFGGEDYLPQGPVVPEITQFNKRLKSMTSNCLALSVLVDPEFAKLVQSRQ